MKTNVKTYKSHTKMRTDELQMLCLIVVQSEMSHFRTENESGTQQ